MPWSIPPSGVARESSGPGGPLSYLLPVTCSTSWPPSRPLIDPDLVSVCCTHPPSRVPSPSLEIGYADRRLGGASVWFIHNPNAISISYTYLVNVQQLVFRNCIVARLR